MVREGTFQLSGNRMCSYFFFWSVCAGRNGGQLLAWNLIFSCNGQASRTPAHTPSSLPQGVCQTVCQGCTADDTQVSCGWTSVEDQSLCWCLAKGQTVLRLKEVFLSIISTYQGCTWCHKTNKCHSMCFYLCHRVFAREISKWWLLPVWGILTCRVEQKF